MAIPSELLDILVCPKCREKVEPDKSNDCVICNNCELMYPVNEDIPVMLIDSAEKLNGN